MPTINQLSSMDTLQSSDKLIIYSNENGDTRKASLASLVSYLDVNYASPAYDTQYAAPTLSGFVATLVQNNAPIWLLLQASSSLGSGTIVLPPATGCFDGQEVLVYAEQPLDVLTVAANGATAVNGAPVGLFAKSSFRLRFNALSNSWFVVSLVGFADYAEGSFTPVYMGSGLIGTVALTGRYTKIGRFYTVEIRITPAVFSGLTFTVATDYFRCTALNAVIPAPYAAGPVLADVTPLAIGSIGEFRFLLSSATPTIVYAVSGATSLYTVNYTI